MRKRRAERVNPTLCSTTALICLTGALSCADKPSLSRPGVGCAALDDCAAPRTCFLGQCVEPGPGLWQVHVEIQPRNDSGLLGYHWPATIDLSQEQRHDFALPQPVTLGGRVTQGGEPQATAGLVAATAREVIPGLVLTRQAPLTEGRFELRLNPGEHVLRLVPNGLMPAIVFPAQVESWLKVLADEARDFSYPRRDELVLIGGMAQAGVEPVPGVHIVGRSTADGLRSLTTPEVVSGLDGTFTLAFPPGVEQLEATTVPLVEEGNAPVPVVRVSSTREAALPGLTLQLGTAPAVELVLTVRDAEGGVVAGADVSLSGRLAVGSHRATGRTATDGRVRMLVIAGDYEAVVVPPLGVPWAATIQHLGTVAEASELEVLLPSLVRVAGTVTTHSGTLVPRAKVSVRGRAPLASREFQTLTDSLGHYELLVDPGSVHEPRDYELFVEPSLVTGAPRHRQTLRVREEPLLRDLVLHRPSFVHGSVAAPDGTPQADVVLFFHSVALGGAIGVTQTDALGEYIVALPTPWSLQP